MNISICCDFNFLFKLWVLHTMLRTTAMYNISIPLFCTFRRHMSICEILIYLIWCSAIFMTTFPSLRRWMHSEWRESCWALSGGGCLLRERNKYVSITAVAITCCALLSRMMLMHHCHMPCRYGEVLIYLILSSAIFMTNVYQQLL